MSDPVNHPAHYTSHPSGVECIQITEHMGFNLGNALKYIWRCDLKRDDIEDLKKAEFYIKREIEKRVKEETIKTINSTEFRSALKTIPTDTLSKFQIKNS